MVAARADMLVWHELRSNEQNEARAMRACKQASGKFLIFVDDELEKEKREKGRKSERSEQKRRREGEREEESNTFPIKPCIWFLLELDPPVVAKIYCGAKRRMCSVLTSLTCMHQIAAASQKQTSQKYYMYQDTRVQGYVWI